MIRPHRATSRMETPDVPHTGVRRSNASSTGATLPVAVSLAAGGAERLLANLLVHGHAPAEDRLLVTMYPGGEFRSMVEAAGVEVLDLGMRSRYDAPRTLWRLVSLLRHRRPAVVHAWDYTPNILAALA